MKFAHSFFASVILSGTLACERPTNDSPPLDPEAPTVATVPDDVVDGSCEAGGGAQTFSSRTIEVAGVVTGPVEHLADVVKLEFVDENTGMQTTAVLQDGAFSVTLSPSRYRVSLNGTTGAYLNYGVNKRLIAEGLIFDDDTDAVQLDSGLNEHTIVTTFGGEPFPAGYRGGFRIEVTTASDELLLRDLPVSGLASVSFAAPVDADYKVIWSRTAEGDIADFANDRSMVPYGEVVLGTFSGDDAGEHAFDVPADVVRIDGAILLAGDPLPGNDLDSDRGQLRIEGLALFDIDRSSDVEFSIPVVPGGYASSLLLYPYETSGESISYASVDLCSDQFARCDDGLCLFDADRSWTPSIDPFAQASASPVTASIFRETALRCSTSLPVTGGSLTFRNLDRFGQQTISIVDGGLAPSSVLEHGRYVVEYNASWSAERLPMGRVVLDSSFYFDGTQSPEWTVMASTVFVDVLVNGDVMPDDALVDGEGRGKLYVHALSENGDAIGGGGTIFYFGEVGAATANIEIVDGTYEFWVTTLFESGKGQESPSSQSVLPHGFRKVGTYTFAGADLDYVSLDLQVAEIDVALTNVALTEDGDESGMVSFQDDTGGFLSVPASSNMTARLYEGQYSAVYRAGADATSASLSGPAGQAIYLGEVCVAR